MIEKIHRFQGRGSLRFVYQKGQTARGAFSSLKYIVNKRRTTFRVAIVVSRKVHKSAVVRNRIRRRMYEIIRQQPLENVAAYDLVFTAYSDQLAELPQADLEQAIVSQLEKAGVFDSVATVPPPQEHVIVEPKEIRK